MKLPITITQVGLQALIDAEQGRTNSVTIASLGLTAQPFIMAPTITGVPAEFKRLDTVAGQSVSDSVIHMTALDDDAETYTVTGFGLYLDNGVLFGIYSQGPADGPLFEKSVAATFLFACDITFDAGQTAVIEFGDANFLYPPASETVKGVAYLATQAEVDAGAVADKMVTPATLKGLVDDYVPIAEKGVANGVASLDAGGRVPPSQLPPLSGIDTFTVGSQAAMLALAATPGDFAQRTDLNETFILTQAPASTLANWTQFLSPGAPVRSVNSKIGDVVLAPGDVGAPPSARQIGVGGLAKGGGDLSADRTITVDIASAAEALAGAINDKAVTPASLASILAALAGKIPSARTINAAGLAQGGGDLSADRTITVPIAAGSDVEGLTNNTKALTAAALAGTLRSIGGNGYLRIPGSPLIIQWSSEVMLAHPSGVTSAPVSYFKSFPIAFPSACFGVNYCLTSNVDDGDEADETPWVRNWQNSGFTIQNEGDWVTFSFFYIALGI